MNKHVQTLLILGALLTVVLFAVTACGAESVTSTPGAAGHEEGEHEGEEHADHAEAEHESEAEHEHEMPGLLPVSLESGEKLRVVATTSIVADVVKNVGGDRIELTQLIPVGADPHAFESAPRDVVKLADAHVVFANGVGLEEFLEPLVEGAEAEERLIEVSHGVELLEFEVDHEQAHEDEGEGDGHDHEGADPHTWTAPTNVLVWVHNIEHTLKALDPEGAEMYEANAQIYEQELEDLDRWVREQIARIPEPNRIIVTDHQVYAYFADEYGLIQAGAVIPGASTLAQPSAEELAKLEDAIEDFGVKSVFVGYTANPNLAQRVAADTGIEVVYLYTGSLSEEGGEADNYLDYIRYNVQAIVNALE